MNSDQFCDGCTMLDFSPPVNRYDLYMAHCCDPKKSVIGTRRVVAVSPIREPFKILRPAWCREKRSQHHEKTESTAANQPA